MEEQLKPVEVTEDMELTEKDYKSLCEQKDSALRLAEDTLAQLRKQLKTQVEMYNKDMKNMTALYTNLVKYNDAKEEGIKKILEGMMELSTLDKRNLMPEEKEEEEDGN